MSGDDFFAFDSISRRPLHEQCWDLVDFSSHGVVLNSSKSFEIGDSIAVGLHMGPHGMNNATRYVELEGVVVQCRQLSRLSTSGRFEITLLLETLPEDAERVLTGLREFMPDPFGLNSDSWKFGGPN